MKDDKEAKRTQARKARDGFMRMLATNTKIDTKTRWRDAQDLLASEGEFAEVEDEREREELFNEVRFVSFARSFVRSCVRSPVRAFSRRSDRV